MQRKSDKIIVFYGLVAFQTEKRNIVFSHQLLHIGVRHKHTFAPYVGHGVIHHVIEYLHAEVRHSHVVHIGKAERKTDIDSFFIFDDAPVFSPDIPRRLLNFGKPCIYKLVYIHI